MTALALVVMLVPLLDQAVKWLVRARAGQRPLSLGLLGQVRIVQSRIWMARALPDVSPVAIWGTWAAAAVAALGVCAVIPAARWPFGLLLGGALSHALDTSLRGSVCDYVCLRFWPAFDLADVALTVGALALLVELARIIA